MSVDLFLPKIVQQAIVSQRLEGNNAPGQHISHNDPSGEGGRSGKAMSSSGTTSGAQFSEHLQAPLQPPYGQYDKKYADKQALPPVQNIEIPANISTFLNDIAKQYGVAPPSAAQLGNAFQQAEIYQPKKITVIESGENAGAKQASVLPPPRINEADIQKALELQKAEAGSKNLQKNKGQSPASDYDFDALPETIRKRTYDYGRMLGALEHYSTKITE